MTDNMKKFLEMVSRSEELAKEINGMRKHEIIAAAQELGMELNDTDFEQATELSDNELDAVAGGGVCACVFGGGGAEDKSDKTCACVLGGGGEDRNGWVRCVCIVGVNGRDNRAMED